MTYDDALLKDVLKRTKRVAVVGVSLNPVRPSYFVARYLHLKGFVVVPVNPAYAGQRLFGADVVAELSDIQEPVDMVDIFRRSGFQDIGCISYILYIGYIGYIGFQAPWDIGNIVYIG